MPTPRLDFRTRTQTDLDAIAREVNERPRQTLEFPRHHHKRWQKCCVGRLNPQA
jgi:IS30 family transposase